MNQVTVCIGQDVALAPLDFLARIVAPRPAALGGFDTLAVDHSCTGRSFAPCRFPADPTPSMIDRKPQTIVPPTVETHSSRPTPTNIRWQNPTTQPHPTPT